MRYLSIRAFKMESEVLESLRDQFGVERERLHPRAKQIFSFLTDFFRKQPSNITFSMFEKAAYKTMSSKESAELFDYLTNLSGHLVLMSGCSQRKFKRDQKVPFSMVAINNIIKEYCFSDSLSISNNVNKPEQQIIQKTVVKTKIISLSDYSYQELKKEIARRDRENERVLKIKQLQEKLRNQKTRLNNAAACVGLTVSGLKQLFLDIDSIESELKKLDV